MKKILITGGSGFIGSAMCEKLLKNKDYQIVVVDNLTTGNIAKLPTGEDYKFIKCDVNEYRDISEIMLSFKFDYVFHYAAVVGVQRTQDNPVSVLRDINGIENILTLSKNTGVKRVFYSSSSEIYGEPVEFPQNVYTTPLNSRLPYAIVKNIGEAFLRSYLKEYGLNYTIFRFFNTYGPKQSRDFVMSRFLLRALENRDIPIYGDGSQTRTFCYIDDNIEACAKAFETNQIVNDVMNVGGAIETPILDLAKMIIRITNSKSKIVFLPPLKEGDMSRRLPDNTRMKEVLGRELVPLEEGIKNILKIGLIEHKC